FTRAMAASKSLSSSINRSRGVGTPAIATNSSPSRPNLATLESSLITSAHYSARCHRLSALVFGRYLGFISRGTFDVASSPSLQPARVLRELSPPDIRAVQPELPSGTPALRR